MKAIFAILLTSLIFMAPGFSLGQNILQTSSGESKSDSTFNKQTHYFKIAEIAYEIENANRFIKDKKRQIKSYQNISEIDSTFELLSTQIEREFEEFGTFNKLNLSKFFLINTKRVWLSYRSQLTNWQTDITGRIKDLMQISESIKEKDKLWNTTIKHPDNEILPEEIKVRILNTITELDSLETYLFEVVGKVSVLDSRIADKTIEVDQHIEIIDDLHNNYRLNIFKATQPAIWKIKLKESYEGTIGARLHKVWYENTKSLKDSIPSFKGNLYNFIIWVILIIAVILSFRYRYLKYKSSKRLSPEDKIKELIVSHPVISMLYMVLFVFILIFNNIPLALSGIISLLGLIITYFLLSPYIPVQGRRIIKTFIILIVANTVEIVFWYFGNYARIYLFMEAGLGLLLISPFLTHNFKKNFIPGLRYKMVVDLLRYPIFLLYSIAFLVNLFGYQNLTVLFLKIGAQVPGAIIIIFGAWEISKSILYTMFQILVQHKKIKSNTHLPLLKKRVKLIVNLFFIWIWFDSLLKIIELDTPFYDAIGDIINRERQIGNFIFNYNDVFQFVLIMLITLGLVSIIKILLSEENFKRTQRLRGVPGAISMTLRIIIAVAGFLLALTGAGIDLTKISILLGAFGVGIGFGLQNIVNNFISGLILIYERPIQVGDTIEINTLMGEVKSIGIRSSHVKTYDGAEVVVPNSILVSDQLINWTLSDDKRRIEIMIGVKYGTDPVKVIEILKQVANDHELVVKDPEPRVLFNEFADSSLNFRLLCWVLFEHGIQTKSDLSVAIDKAFKENNIEIPFPQLDLHVIDTPVEKESTNSQEKSQEDAKPLIAGGSGINESDSGNNK